MSKNNVITIEIAGENNEQVLFPPTQDLCRGRWNYGAGKRDRSGALRNLEVGSHIPGMMISINLSEKSGRIFDPLEGEKGKEFLDEFNKKCVENPIFGKTVTFRQASNYTLDEDQIKTWLFHMSTLLEHKLAKLTNNSSPMPKKSEIAKMPGKRIKDPGNSGPKEKDLAASAFVDVVPLDPA